MKSLVLVIPAMRYGGAERVMANLANSFSRKGYKVSLISLQKSVSPYALDDKVNYICSDLQINRSNKFFKSISLILMGIRSFFFYSKLIKKLNPDVVLSFLDNATFITSLYKKMHPKLFTVVSERNDVTRNPRILLVLKKFFYRDVDKLICQSRVIASYYNKELKIPLKKLAVIENPLSLDSYEEEVTPLTQRKSEIISVGRLAPQKNFDLLIDCFKKVHDVLPYYNLKIIGEGELRNSLQKKIDDLELKDYISMVGHEEYPLKKNRKAKLFVMTSRYEGFPNVLIEAMANAFPIVTTNFSPGVAKEIIKDEKYGSIVNSFDPEEMSNKIINTLTDDKILEHQISNNIYVRDRFDESLITKKWEQVLFRKDE
ncbi:glycosyltransferase [Enterococcus pallens]|uniref:Glycosyl transferase family 1 domain-containing protein n=1 Tax=Enterococcus pallens ATCC BAA-351 TaxID=1158607 RepID=R2SQ38_9ENTE|nr:glycosyltransferase [Enterococcus pallens]EOH94901.1 hypothetical protein UAU_01823 [Enterococcus pallens ATCC BAA-351]EOU14780.1 hypothetical protein I588_04430 [Enterococcus pallens ATCC BAA-351]OJG77185.1 hypothetical protein RV10_GL002924 [Enterococcus pallens]